jgi:hypothetical protein
MATKRKFRPLSPYHATGLRLLLVLLCSHVQPTEHKTKRYAVKCDVLQRTWEDAFPACCSIMNIETRLNIKRTPFLRIKNTQPHILWNQKVQYRAPNSPPLVPILRHANSVCAAPSYLFRIHFKIIFSIHFYF